MQIKCKFEHWLPKILKVTAITLYPFIFFSCNQANAIKNRTINHEFIHVEQMRLVGVLHFYISYLLEYHKNRKTLSKVESYLNISYEIDAYRRQANFVLPDEAKRWVL